MLPRIYKILIIATVALDANLAHAARLWLIKHSWHTGLAVAVDDLPPDMWPERADLPHRRFLEVGWGAKEFYMAEDPGLWLALKAGLTPGPSVLHVVGFDQPPAHAFPNSPVEERQLTAEQFAAVVKFVDRSFARGTAARSPPLGPGLYGDSRFYDAHGKYHALRTCNDWLDDALDAAVTAPPSAAP